MLPIGIDLSYESFVRAVRLEILFAKITPDDHVNVVARIVLISTYI